VELNESTRAEDVDRYWDSVVRGHDPAPARSGSDLTQLVNRLHRERGPIPTLFSDPRRAWRELSEMAPPETPVEVETDHVRPIWIGPNGRATPPISPEPGTGRRSGASWVLAQLATAALLVITLVAGYIAFGLRAPSVNEDSLRIPAPARIEDRDSFIPATAGVGDDMLFAAMYTAEMLPAGGKEAVFYRIVLAPGSSIPNLLGPCVDHHCQGQIGSGVGAEVVRSGVYSLRLDTPLRVRRAGAAGSGEAIPAGTEVILQAGDAAFYGEYAAAGEIRNASNESLDVVGVAILSTEEPSLPVPGLHDGVTGEVFTRTVSSDWQTLPPGPVVVNLHRLTLPPETTLGPYDALGLEAMYVASGEISRSLLRAGAEEPVGPAHPRSAGRALPFIAAGPGARHIVANPDDQPAEILVVTIAPAGLWSGPLGP
jgi:hypothetical protein